MRILIADDQANVRSALRLLLEQASQIEIVGEVADATGLLLLLGAKQPDLLLLDWELPGLPADHLMRLLRFEQPHLRVLAMSSRPEAQQEAETAGVDGFVSKGDPPEYVLTALNQIISETGEGETR